MVAGVWIHYMLAVLCVHVEMFVYAGMCVNTQAGDKC